VYFQVELSTQIGPVGGVGLGGGLVGGVGLGGGLVGGVGLGGGLVGGVGLGGLSGIRRHFPDSLQKSEQHSEERVQSRPLSLQPDGGGLVGGVGLGGGLLGGGFDPWRQTALTQLLEQQFESIMHPTFVSRQVTGGVGGGGVSEQT